MYYYNSHLEDMSEKYIFACFTKFQCLKFHQHYILVSLLVTHAISEVSEAKSHEEVSDTCNFLKFLQPSNTGSQVVSTIL